MRTVLLCPFTAGTVLWQAQNGAWTLTACIRATFALVHGREATLAGEQEPVAGDRFVGGGLFAPAELIPFKPRADVMLVGSAFAPGSEPVEALVTRLRFGALDKSLGVIGDRVWIEGPDGPEPSGPRTFHAMPLGHDRAARAPDNPAGFDLTRAPAIGALALPNLEAADDEILPSRTIGFGPILPTASTRKGLLHGEAVAWVNEGGRGPAPADLDFGFYNAAPRDQQLDQLELGATLMLDNLNREHAHLEVRLPTTRPKAFLVGAELGRGVEVALRLDTLWIDTDRALLTLSFRGLVVVDGPEVEQGSMLVVAAETKGRTVDYQMIERMLRDGDNVTTNGDTFTDPVVEEREGPTRARPIVPLLGGAAPVVLEVGDPPSWEEISSTELLESTSTDEPKTISRVGIQRLSDDPSVDEPSTRPMLAAPGKRVELGVRDHARIAAAVERGDLARVLFGYGLGLPDLPRLQRLWKERSAQDPEFAAELARHLEAARRR